MSVFNTLYLTTLISEKSTFIGRGSDIAADSTIYIAPAITPANISNTIYFTYLDVPNITLSSGSIANAYTMYINGPPTVSGGGSVDVSYSLYINSGSSYFGGQIKSSVATGIAPLVVSSTTNIPNLNASSLNGFTFVNPGSIGTAVASNAVFTTARMNLLELNGTESGIVSIKPQANAGTYNFNIPTTSGTAGQILVSGGGINTPMEWLTPTYWMCSLQYPSGTNGGRRSGGTLQAVPLNTIVSSSNNNRVTLNTTNGFITITPGIYYIEANVVGYRVGVYWSAFVNSTTLAKLLTGTTASSPILTGLPCHTMINGILTVSATTTYYLASIAGVSNGNGLGISSGRGIETYATCTIRSIP